MSAKYNEGYHDGYNGFAFSTKYYDAPAHHFSYREYDKGYYQGVIDSLVEAGYTEAAKYLTTIKYEV